MLLKVLDDVTDESAFGELSISGLEFFGLDTRRYAAAPLRLRLRRSGVSVLSCVSGANVVGFAGYRMNTANHRQAEISTCVYVPDDTGPVIDALVGALRSVRRVSSFVAALRSGSPDRSAYLDRGFVHIGTLRSALYRDYAYRDCEMLHLSADGHEGVTDGIDAQAARSRDFEASAGR
jgi:hypothetical protein